MKNPKRGVLMGIIQEILEKHLGKAVGILIGILFGLLAIKYGLLRAIFVALCALAGYYIGKRLDERVDFGKYFQGSLGNANNGFSLRLKKL